MVRLLLWTVLIIVGLIAAGSLLVWAVTLALGLIGYLAVGALVVGGGIYLYRRSVAARAPRQLR